GPRARIWADARALRSVPVENGDASVPSRAIAVVRGGVRAAPVRRMGDPAPPGIRVIDTYLGYLRDVRRMSPNTVESYARALGGLAAFGKRKGGPAEAPAAPAASA